MDKITKVIVSVIAIIFVIGIAALAGSASDRGGHVPGIVGLILFGALFGGLKAIWKEDKGNKTNKNNDNNSILQK